MTLSDRARQRKRQLKKKGYSDPDILLDLIKNGYITNKAMPAHSLPWSVTDDPKITETKAKKNKKEPKQVPLDPSPEPPRSNPILPAVPKTFVETENQDLEDPGYSPAKPDQIPDGPESPENMPSAPEKPVAPKVEIDHQFAKMLEHMKFATSQGLEVRLNEVVSFFKEKKALTPESKGIALLPDDMVMLLNAPDEREPQPQGDSLPIPDQVPAAAESDPPEEGSTEN